MRRILEEKIDEIICFGRKNGGRIRPDTVIDILKDKEDTFDSGTLAAVFDEIGQNGITIGPEPDEGYPAQAVEPDIFIPADVNISQKTVNIYNLMERLDNYEIDLNPGFQRHSNLWSLEKQSQLIESLMLKIPIPAFYFDASDEGNWIVIDGLQRLTAFQNFLVGVEDDKGVKQKKKFTGLQYLKDFNDFTFDDLPRQYVRRIKETAVIAYAVEKGTPDEVVFNIFQRINTGGVPLNDQEIRQAMYQGKATDLIQRLAESESFRRATGNAIQEERMLDREYVTRFLAFTELDYRKEYKGNIDNYLIKAIKRINDYDEERLDEIEKRFQCIMNYCADIFGRYAFRKYNENRRRGPINKAIFELWSVCFSELGETELAQIVNRRDEFIDEFGRLLQNSEFISALKSGDQYSAGKRIEMARKMVKEFVC